jgi:L-ascorbate metabolism protein UlaG (beta-lactamase superfamily)
MDPYHSGQGLNYAPPDESADIVTKSHDHSDHSNIQAIKGNPAVIDKTGSYNIKGIEIKSVRFFMTRMKGNSAVKI